MNRKTPRSRKPRSIRTLTDLLNAFEPTTMNMRHWSVAGHASGHPTPTKG